MTGSVDQGGHPITLYRRIYNNICNLNQNNKTGELPGQVQINYTDVFSFKKSFEKNFQKYFQRAML